MATQNQTSKFYGLNIIHPHSGKASRAIISRVVKHEVKGYINGKNDKENAQHLINTYGIATLVLKDHNNIISLDYSSVN